MSASAAGTGLSFAEENPAATATPDGNQVQSSQTPAADLAANHSSHNNSVTAYSNSVMACDRKREQTRKLSHHTSTELAMNETFMSTSVDDLSIS